jgi:hypothetical protein
MDFQPSPALENTASGVEPMQHRPKRRGRRRIVLTADEEHGREERRLAKRRERYGNNTYECECGQIVKKDNKQHNRTQAHIRVMERGRHAGAAA